MECVHGERVRRQGTSAKGPWVGWFCSQPKGAEDQCPPVFENKRKVVSAQAAAPAQPTSSQSIVLLQNILTELQKHTKILQGAAQQPELVAAEEQETVSVDEIPF